MKIIISTSNMDQHGPDGAQMRLVKDFEAFFDQVTFNQTRGGYEYVLTFKPKLTIAVTGLIVTQMVPRFQEMFGKRYQSALIGADASKPVLRVFVLPALSSVK